MNTIATGLPASLGPEASLAWELSDTELARLFGYPPASGRSLEGEVLAGADRARHWYQAQGTPFAFARLCELDRLDGDGLVVAGTRLDSPGLSAFLGDAGADAVVVVALSAGGAVDREVSRLWQDGRPDEAYFLDRVGAAVTERLAVWTRARLSEMAAPHGASVLAPTSPGYSGWPLEDQPKLWELVRGDGTFPGGLDLRPSGMLDPIHSTLGLLGLSPHRHPNGEEPSCTRCRLVSCSFRRSRTAPVLDLP